MSPPKAHIDQTPGHYSLGVATFDFDNDGWPDIYIACDSTASILFRNNHDGTFHRYRRDRGSRL